MTVLSTLRCLVYIYNFQYVVHAMRHAALMSVITLPKPEILFRYQAVLSLQLLTNLLIVSFSFKCQTQTVERPLALSWVLVHF